jgi:hypothetical protein
MTTIAMKKLKTIRAHTEITGKFYGPEQYNLS